MCAHRIDALHIVRSLSTFTHIRFLEPSVANFLVFVAGTVSCDTIQQLSRSGALVLGSLVHFLSRL